MNTIKGEHKLTHNSCYCNFPEKCDIHERYTWLRRKKGAHPICRPQSLIKLNLSGMTKACYIWDCNGGGGGGGGAPMCWWSCVLQTISSLSHYDVHNIFIVHSFFKKGVWYIVLGHPVL